ncbi:MAG: DUF1028 domain-containing protein [Thermomicrobiales bacterium]|nr:DUF1028 domain-containing protein [Thermomicrobiales bacterium]
MTFSITARDPETGMFGIAVSTKLLCVGHLVPFTAAGVGAVATQSFVNPYIGIRGVDYLKQGMDASAVRNRLSGEDGRIQQRQFSIVDAAGTAISFTGGECIGWAGHRTGDGYACAGNMLTGQAVIDEMARAYEERAGDLFAERLLAAVEAGQAAGGDRRGRQSAALKVVWTEDYPYIDLRVDDSTDPVPDLRRLWELWQSELMGVMELMPSKQHPDGQFDLELLAPYLPK